MKKAKVLIVDDEKDVLNNLKAALERHDLSVRCTQTNDEAINILKSDREIKVILLDYYLAITKGEHKGQLQCPIGDALIGEFKNIRKDIPVFYITDKAKWEEICKDTKADFFFDKNELEDDGAIEFLAGTIKRKADEYKIAPGEDAYSTPFYDALKKYVEDYRFSWHTPGHSGGDSFRTSEIIKDFYDFFGANIFRADLSVSVDELDSLLEPRGVIAEAQRLAAKAFGADYTFFVTNGTSTANKIVIQTIVQPGEKLILDRNCHKSVHYAVILSGAKPVYLQPSVNNEYGIFGPVPMKTIRSTIEGNKDAKAIIITNCTYDGLIYNLKEIVSLAHTNKMKVIVDEAWFGYAYFHPDLKPYSAMECKADYATQSTHKILSAFSQASMIHVKDHVKDKEFKKKYEHTFAEHFCMHTSTSPQYSMIASLDIARKQMQLEGEQLIQNAINIANRLRRSISEHGKFEALDKERILENFEPSIKADGIGLDPTKLLVHTNDIDAKDVKDFLSKRGIVVEKKTFNTLLFLVTIAITNTKAGSLMAGLTSYTSDKKRDKCYCLPSQLPKNVMLPREAFYEACKEGKGEWVELEKAKDRISAGMVVPYPPGIPVLLPGEIVSEEVLEYLKKIKEFDSGAEIHGQREGKIWVLKQSC